MSIQIWKIEGEIIGSFFIVFEEELKASIPFTSQIVQDFSIFPEFNDRNEQTGKFNVIITFKIDSKEIKPPPNLIADIGRDAFNNYIDLLAFLSGNSIRIINQLKLTYNYPGTNKYRCILFPDQQAVIKPPVPLTNTSIFAKKLEYKHSIILAWFRRALQEKDVVNSILSIFISLEILANQFPCEQKIIQECNNCGHIMESRSGMRIQIENFLIKEVDYSTEQFLKIWKLRNDIYHGRLVTTLEKIRDLNLIKQELILAIIKGMKKLLGISSSEFPKETLHGPSFSDPMLDIDYILPDKK